MNAAPAPRKRSKPRATGGERRPRGRPPRPKGEPLVLVRITVPAGHKLNKLLAGKSPLEAGRDVLEKATLWYDAAEEASSSRPLDSRQPATESKHEPHPAQAPRPPVRTATPQVASAASGSAQITEDDVLGMMGFDLDDSGT